MPEEAEAINEAVVEECWPAGLGPGQEMGGGMEQGAWSVLGSSSGAEGVEEGRFRVVVGQRLLDGGPPGDSLLGKGVTPADDGGRGGEIVLGTTAHGLTPGSILLEAGRDHLLDDGQKIVAKAEKETGQKSDGMATSLAEPAFDGDGVDLGLVFGLAGVEAVANEGMRGMAEGAALWAVEDDLVEAGDVFLDRWAAIEYDGHVLDEPDPKDPPPSRTFRAGLFLFREMGGKSLLDFAPSS
jgi:hypothetical protein